MNVQQRVNAFKGLAGFLHDFLNNSSNPLSSKFTELDKIIHESYLYNGWFTNENIHKALSGLAAMLSNEALDKVGKLVKEPTSPKVVAIIMAGNIPAVGFHDAACVLLSGNKVLIKLSSDDKLLIPFLLNVLVELELAFANQIAYAENKLTQFEAVIATGSNNTSNYFEYYFGKYPHIIRKNRNSVAVLTGNETEDDLTALGADIFDYFGMGCRNVSKVFVPKDYVFDKLFEAVFQYGYVLDNKKYGNNYEYNRNIYLMMQDKFLDNNFFIIKKDVNSFSSPIGVLLQDEYESIADLTELLNVRKEEIQCVVSKDEIKGFPHIPFGGSQCPGFFDYADGVDVIAFLNTLSS